MVVPILHLVACATPAAICHRQAVTLSVCDAMLVRGALFGVLPTSVIAFNVLIVWVTIVVLIASLRLWVAIVVPLPLILSIILSVVGLWVSGGTLP